MKKVSPLSSPPNRGPRITEIFFSLVYMRTLQPCKPGQVWSRGIVIIFWWDEIQNGNHILCPYSMNYAVLCSSRNFIAILIAILLWKLNQKTLDTLFIINLFRENSYRSSGNENNRKNKESCYINERLSLIHI